MNSRQRKIKRKKQEEMLKRFEDSGPGRMRLWQKFKIDPSISLRAKLAATS